MDTHESISEASAKQMLRPWLYHEYNIKINLSALLRKNRMLEIIGVDYPALREQLFLTEGLSTEQLEVRILEGTELLITSIVPTA